MKVNYIRWKLYSNACYARHNKFCQAHVLKYHVGPNQIPSRSFSQPTEFLHRTSFAILVNPHGAFRAKRI